ncbi:sugar phosphate isomerase/epimerase [Actinomadura sp. CNU-125]|uniref:sugar phosphate isomerase/epimerase n=1 Tax=Actinomadura sp. CNU-125 TaxID=1904961 RepID=UPI0021CC66AE|nr:sugar phosphate isomerase/epimerase [Actinomadura sp. CNU-125]
MPRTATVRPGRCWTPSSSPGRSRDFRPSTSTGRSRQAGFGRWRSRRRSRRGTCVPSPSRRRSTPACSPKEVSPTPIRRCGAPPSTWSPLPRRPDASSGSDYVKLWPGQDGYDYPFQADYADLWDMSVSAVRELALAFPDLRFAIEYKPREPRNRMVLSSVARTLLAIDDMGVGNVGVLLDFGHSLFGGETPAESARMAIARNRLFAIDVNDNFRGWDDDMVVGSVHLLETFEFFFALHDAGWDGVWQLDQFPFREDPVEAARTGIRTMRAFHRALGYLDRGELAEAQAAQDALRAQRIAKRALFRALAESEDE